MIELKSKINKDKYTEYVCEQFDIQNKEETSVSIPMNLDGINDIDWNIGVLYGGSGSGKTTILKHLGKIKEIELDTTIPLYLCYKHLEKDYNYNEIDKLIKNTDNINYLLNFQLFKLIEDKSYLETAYNQIHEKADAMEDELKEKFLTYPIPKQIIEEYNMVFNNPPSQ